VYPTPGNLDSQVKDTPGSFLARRSWLMKKTEIKNLVALVVIVVFDHRRLQLFGVPAIFVLASTV
jgi:hypothetical protein